MFGFRVLFLVNLFCLFPVFCFAGEPISVKIIGSKGRCISSCSVYRTSLITTYFDLERELKIIFYRELRDKTIAFYRNGLYPIEYADKINNVRSIKIMKNESLPRGIIFGSKKQTK